MKGVSFRVVALLIGATLFSSCSTLSQSGRRERAYAHYVRASSLARAKQQKRLGSMRTKSPVAQPSEALESSGPEAVGNL